MVTPIMKRIFLFLLALALLLFSALPVVFLNNQARADTSEGWFVQETGIMAWIYEISAVDQNIAWAAGYDAGMLGSGCGYILKTVDGGITWNKQFDTPEWGGGFTGIHAVNKDVAWAVRRADNDNAYVTTNGGTTWNPRPSSTGLFRHVYAFDHDTAWIVGDSIDMTTTGGTTWDTQYKGKIINCLDAFDRNTAWAVGWEGKILKTTNGGKDWFSQNSGVTVDLTSVSVLDKDTAWVVGYEGVILKTTDGGANWILQSPGTKSRFYGVAAVDEDTVWAVGGEWDVEGTILKTCDGGITWIPQVSGKTLYLLDICPLNSNYAWIGGAIQKPGAGPVESINILKTTSGGWFSPMVTSVSPEYGAAGSEVTIRGSGFYSPQGQSTVSFGTEMVAEYISWSDTEIKCKVPANLVGKVEVSVSSYGGVSNLVDFTAVKELYFAEGCTREGFSEWLSIQNPSTEDIEVFASYMMASGMTSEDSYIVPATSRVSVNVNDAVGPGKDVSVRLWAAGDFYAERPMYFIYKGGIEGYSWADGHVAAGVPSPRNHWYFAEGCTRTGFEEWLCVQNPNDSEVRVGIDYISAGAYSAHKDYFAPANSRISVFVNGDMGPGQDVSAHVYCDSPIVVERPMYFNYLAQYNTGEWSGGHVVMGVDSPTKEWYFAEGCTREGFEEYLCIQNPNDSNANLTVDYATSGGNVTNKYLVPANSRYTLNLNNELGQGLDVACHIISDQDIICERPMYFSYTGEGAPGWSGGSNVLGVSSPKTTWYFPEGYTGPDFQEWLCLNNVSSNTASVVITYNILGAPPKTVAHDVPPGRYTVFVNNDAGVDLQFSTKIVSSEPITAERAMYFSYNGGWDGGHCSTGFSQ